MSAHGWQKGPDDERIRNFKICRFCGIRDYDVFDKGKHIIHIRNFWGDPDSMRKGNGIRDIDLFNKNRFN